ncbi:LOW QUALITY PROTEIN: hypothetical protein IFM46972_05961 [Aspergillus udagawae]|uniref:Uncharacterized protein n=1 Tax=Aspergillus udagawae TaxID=91492 RepID=A0A8H3NVX1_9EURO|nr:LOW QUALITY PROTEIN: hypothetical protein IFM46972_05961 [Aspergillus udagawae]
MQYDTLYLHQSSQMILNPITPIEDATRSSQAKPRSTHSTPHVEIQIPSGTSVLVLVQPEAKPAGSAAQPPDPPLPVARVPALSPGQHLHPPAPPATPEPDEPAGASSPAPWRLAHHPPPRPHHHPHPPPQARLSDPPGDPLTHIHHPAVRPRLARILGADASRKPQPRLLVQEARAPLVDGRCDEESAEGDVAAASEAGAFTARARLLLLFVVVVVVVGVGVGFDRPPRQHNPPDTIDMHHKRVRRRPRVHLVHGEHHDRGEERGGQCSGRVQCRDNMRKCVRVQLAAAARVLGWIG